jgi:hypothetical protein
VSDRPATIGIGAKVVGHARTVAFQMAAVAISKNLCAGPDGGATAVRVQVFGRRHHEGRLLLRRPASKKRQGTKSREVWGRVGSQRYGDLLFASIMTVGVKLAPGDLDRVRKGSWKRNGDLGGGVKGMSGRSTG